MSLQHFHWGVLFLEEPMLDVKRIRNDFDALAEKLWLHVVSLLKL